MNLENKIIFHDILKLYVVRNSENKFFRSKGYGGYGKTWVDTISEAKVYTKIGQARSRVTWFYKTYPQFGLPDIIELLISEGNVLHEKVRVDKIVEKDKRQKEVHEKEKVRQRQLEIQNKIKMLNLEMNSLKGK